MRLGFDGLARARQGLGENPPSGDLLVFASRRADRVKIPWWDRDGPAPWAKRLERGAFRRPPATATRVGLTAAQLAMPVEGIDPAGARRRRLTVLNVRN